jgi:hypothetical protein
MKPESRLPQCGLSLLTAGMVLLAAVSGLCFAVSAFAGEQIPAHPKPAGDAETGSQSLGQAAEDPTASLMSVQLADWYAARFHGLDDEDANTVVLRSAIPFQTGDLKHILRATIPFITDSPFLDSGLSDATLFDLVVFNQSWGRWGVGPVALMPTGGSQRGAEQWALGPALGFTARKGKLLWGAFNQNLFTYAGDKDRTPVNASVLQPIVSYGLGHGWSTGVSEMTFTYDYEAGRWASLPLGAKIAKLMKLGKLPVQFSLQYEHDFADQRGTPEDTVRFAMKLLFPVR